MHKTENTDRLLPQEIRKMIRSARRAKQKQEALRRKSVRNRKQWRTA